MPLNWLVYSLLINSSKLVHDLPHYHRGTFTLTPPSARNDLSPDVAPLRSLISFGSLLRGHLCRESVLTPTCKIVAPLCSVLSPFWVFLHSTFTTWHMCICSFICLTPPIPIRMQPYGTRTLSILFMSGNNEHIFLYAKHGASKKV